MINRLVWELTPFSKNALLSTLWLYSLFTYHNGFSSMHLPQIIFVIPLQWQSRKHASTIMEKALLQREWCRYENEKHPGRNYETVRNIFGHFWYWAMECDNQYRKTSRWYHTTLYYKINKNITNPLNTLHYIDLYKIKQSHIEIS